MTMRNDCVIIAPRREGVTPFRAPALLSARLRLRRRELRSELKSKRVCFCLLACSRSLMDKIPVCGTGAPGSTPGESTKRKAPIRRFSFCARAASKLLCLRQESNGAALLLAHHQSKKLRAASSSTYERVRHISLQEIEVLLWEISNCGTTPTLYTPNNSKIFTNNGSSRCSSSSLASKILSISST